MSFFNPVAKCSLVTMQRSGGPSPLLFSIMFERSFNAERSGSETSTIDETFCIFKYS